jgi:hypothetical protein
VGRVAFDTPAQYESWVSKAIGGARETAPRRRALTVFGTRHPNDPATQLSSEHLLRPLVAGFEPNGTFGKLIEDLVVHQMLGADATKAKLADVLRGTSEVSQPAILFSATHGVGGFPPGDPQQTMCQGALLCQDWLGAGQIGPGSYFAASDLGVDAQVDGMVMFMFACYSAGTPLYDSYLGRVPEAPSRISVAPFVAKLPQALLEAGAVGVVGHVDRAWGYSFVSGDVESILPFQNAIGRILRGEPVGHAVKEFHDRYAVLSASLAATLDNVRFGEVVSDRVIAALSTERADAQNYLLLGDPAAVVAMAGVSGPGESPAG